MTPEREKIIADAMDELEHMETRLGYSRVLSQLAIALVEPVEKERDGAARDHHRSWPECPECLHYFREDENYAMLNAKQASELAEAREENTRLREQLDAARKALQGMIDYADDYSLQGALMFASTHGYSGTPESRQRNIVRVFTAREVLTSSLPLWAKLAALGDAVPEAEWDKAAHLRVLAAEEELEAARAALEPRPPLRDEPV